MRPLILFFTCMLPLWAAAQHVVTGRVVDATTNEPLAFVPFVIEGSRLGTTSDIDGRFTLVVPHLPVTLRASYVGYEPQVFTVTDVALFPVRLVPSNIELQAVKVLPSENPAHRIIRAVHANRKENDGLHRRSYRYTSYGKTVFDLATDSAQSVGAGHEGRVMPDTTLAQAVDTAKLDSGEAKFLRMLQQQHLLLIESATKKSFIPPSSAKETVLAMRVSGLKDPSILGLAAQTETFSIYAAQIDIGDKSYLGPIGPGSTAKYLFLLEDTLYQGNDSVYVISYRPRRGTKFDGLKGLLYINTDGYAVQNVTAEPMVKSGISIRFQQQHRRFPTATGGMAWFPEQLNTFIYAGMLSVNGLNVMGEGRIYLKDIELDVDIPRKEVRGPELVMEQMSIRRDSALWAGLRPTPLDARELRTYESIDSLGERENLDRKLKFLSALATGRLPLGAVDLRLNQIIAFNDHEGFRLGVGLVTNDRVSRLAALGGYVAHGFGDHQWKYGGDLSLRPVYGRDLGLKLAYENDVAETGGVRFAKNQGLLDTEGFRMFFVDRMDRIERYSAKVHTRVGSSLKLWIGTERAQRVNELGYAYISRVSDQVVLRQGSFLTGAFTLDLRWAYKEKLARLPGREFSLGTKYPVVWLHAMRAEKGLWDGEWETWRVDAQVEKTFKIRLLGELSLRAMGGLADPEAPMPFLYNMRGINNKRFPVAGSQVFETMHPNEFLADRYISFHLKHSFGKLLVNTKHFKPRPAIVSSVAFGDLSHPENHEGLSFRPLRQGFYESGLLLENLLRSGFSSFGVGVFYRYGPYALPSATDNFAVKLAMGFVFD